MNSSILNLYYICMEERMRQEGKVRKEILNILLHLMETVQKLPKVKAWNLHSTMKIALFGATGIVWKCSS